VSPRSINATPTTTSTAAAMPRRSALVMGDELFERARAEDFGETRAGQHDRVVSAWPFEAVDRAGGDAALARELALAPAALSAQPLEGDGVEPHVGSPLSARSPRLLRVWRPGGPVEPGVAGSLSTTTIACSGITPRIASGIIRGMAADQSVKIRENAARRRLQRQGFRLVKTRRRDTRAVDYGTYAIVPAGGRRSVADGLSLDRVERWIDGER
jgi:hypothetical protein